MPEYLYRREDGSTFTIRQRFMDDPLTVDPETGQKVNRVIQPTGVIFKGSGFYINDSKDASKKSLTPTSETPSSNGNGNGHSPESPGVNGKGSSTESVNGKASTQTASAKSVTHDAAP
jgi:predicted nucleic acid-binding Zn ribbon protein